MIPLAIWKETVANRSKRDWVTHQRLIKPRTSGTAKGVQITVINLNIALSLSLGVKHSLCHSVDLPIVRQIQVVIISEPGTNEVSHYKMQRRAILGDFKL